MNVNTISSIYFGWENPDYTCVEIRYIINSTPINTVNLSSKILKFFNESLLFLYKVFIYVDNQKLR